VTCLYSLVCIISLSELIELAMFRTVGPYMYVCAERVFHL